MCYVVYCITKCICWKI